jgi:hypothetical protein
LKHKLDLDLTCNLDSGPSWSLLKSIDYLVCFEQNNDIEFSSYDFLSTPKDIKSYFEKLLDNYKIELEESLNKLKYFVSHQNKYQTSLCIKFCELQLGIIDKNFKILNDEDSWLLLF